MDQEGDTAETDRGEVREIQQCSPCVGSAFLIEEVVANVTIDLLLGKMK